MNHHAGFLLHLVECLNTASYTCRNVRPGSAGATLLLVNRFLLTVTKESLEKNPDDTIMSLCRRLGMRRNCLWRWLKANLPTAKFVHFGFEENETACTLQGIPWSSTARARRPARRFCCIWRSSGTSPTKRDIF